MSVSEFTGHNSALGGAYRVVQYRVVQSRLRLPTLPRIENLVEQDQAIPITELYKLPPKFGADLRSMGPTHICTCGCDIFRVACSFEDNEISFYFLDAECLNCGNLVTVPTLDDETLI